MHTQDVDAIYITTIAHATVLWFDYIATLGTSTATLGDYIATLGGLHRDARLFGVVVPTIIGLHA